MEVINDNYKLYQGDCLKVIKNIPSKSINLVLIDPPYNIGKDKWDKWETVEDYIQFMGKVFLEIQRVLKDNGSFYFFHNDFLQIVELQNWINKNTDFVFKQLITWNKIHEDFKNYGYVQQRLSVDMIRNYYNGFTEYCLYYTFQTDSGDIKEFKSLRDYFKYIQSETGLNKEQIIDKIGQRADHCFRHSSTQWNLPTEETYNALIDIFNIDKYKGFKTYEELREEYEELRYTFNTARVKEDLRANSNVWLYPPAKKQGHITPKPVEMLENIINHSTNKGDVVLDCFMGSGSTGVACLNTKRRFIGIEKDGKYFNISKERLEDAKLNNRQKRLF
jgi:site-specific DNA-methyltransferase (adenine-specific)